MMILSLFVISPGASADRGTSLLLYGTDGTLHTTWDSREDLGLFVKGATVVGDLGIQYDWIFSGYFLEWNITLVSIPAVVADYSALLPITALSPDNGILHGDQMGWGYSEISPLTMSIPTGSLAIGHTYEGALKADHAGVGDKPGYYYFEFTVGAGLTVSTDPSNVAPTIGSGIYAEGTVVSISAPESIEIVPGVSRYHFVGWNGSSIADVTAASTTVVMDSRNETVTADYAMQFWVQFRQEGVGGDYQGPVMTIDGIEYNASGHAGWYENGTLIDFNFSSPLVVAVSGKQYLLIGTDTSSPLIVSRGLAVTGTYDRRKGLEIYGTDGRWHPTPGTSEDLGNFQKGTTIKLDLGVQSTWCFPGYTASWNLAWSPSYGDDFNALQAATTYSPISGALPGISQSGYTAIASVTMNITTDALSAGKTYLGLLNVSGGANDQWPGHYYFEFTLEGPPSPPRNLQVAFENGNVQLAWDPPGSDGGWPVANYLIFRGPASDGMALIKTTGNVLNYSDYLPTVDASAYYYEVKALNRIGPSNSSNIAVFVVATGGRAPGAPWNLTATPGLDFVKLTWDPPSDRGWPLPMTYQIYRRTVFGGDQLIATVNGSTNFTDMNAIAGFLRSYKVVSSNSIGNRSGYSNQVWSIPLADVAIIGMALLAIAAMAVYVYRRRRSYWRHR